MVWIEGSGKPLSGEVANSDDAACTINQLSSNLALQNRSRIVRCRGISCVWRSL